MTSETPPPTPAPGTGMCLPFWTPYGHHCYFAYNGEQGFSWPESRHYCQSVRGELASVHSRAEVEFIRNLNYTKYHNLWIGLTRDNNCKTREQRYYKGISALIMATYTRAPTSNAESLRVSAVGWAWTDKTSLGFVNWAPGEPNTAFHPGEAVDENCVEMYQDGRWNDNNCLEKRGFVCRHRQCKLVF